MAGRRAADGRAGGRADRDAAATPATPTAATAARRAGPTAVAGRGRSTACGAVVAGTTSTRPAPARPAWSAPLARCAGPTTTSSSGRPGACRSPTTGRIATAGRVPAAGVPATGVPATGLPATERVCAARRISTTWISTAGISTAGISTARRIPATGQAPAVRRAATIERTVEWVPTGSGSGRHRRRYRRRAGGARSGRTFPGSRGDPGAGVRRSVPARGHRR